MQIPKTVKPAVRGLGADISGRRPIAAPCDPFKPVGCRGQSPDLHPRITPATVTATFPEGVEGLPNCAGKAEMSTSRTFQSFSPPRTRLHRKPPARILMTMFRQRNKRRPGQAGWSYPIGGFKRPCGRCGPCYCIPANASLREDQSRLSRPRCRCYATPNARFPHRFDRRTHRQQARSTTRLLRPPTASEQ